ncbi:alpha beta-hydrolase [Suillus plorans]|uniref:Alpha beta-hydrolase n=1 Tax=Suillus plorans TaxID=116603 RepID=A0A9P7J7K2_9AGAM|nr:alpha beta-hydrolase [Suillus plorans]KAG1806633.1 alpha beta-hydrolase [Suillus plorans]
MTVSTFSAAVHITPTVIKTLYTHGKRKAKKLKNGDEKEEATDDIFFDEAFHIVKSFILLGTKNTVESLQAFTNTHVPAPPWTAVIPVRVPLHSCNQAADLLIQWFGPEDLKRVVGGERWWQVRGLDGIDAEWIAEKSHLRPESVHIDAGRRYSEEERLLMSMEQLETTMLYIHGGGYYWGSINTHRYQIIKYAHKIRGRAFTVNYRKAPQYPWPCPLHDVLAAYLYLIQPPHDAAHKPIPPSKIVFAGDSAGGALCLTMLTVLRDLGQPLPAGAVLISPWVDLTHSFPSIRTNTATDIIPPHGFMNKPSVLWPVDPIEGGGRVARAHSDPLLKPCRADIPGSDKHVTRHTAQVLPTDAGKKSDSTPVGSKHQLSSNSALSIPLKSQKKSSFFDGGKCDLTGRGHGRSRDQNGNGSNTIPMDELAVNRGSVSIPNLDDIDFWQPNPPKVLMKNPGDVPLEIRSQIQHYAMTEQLSHPLVSPILQASLGNLCPLYILAGDGEVLRDEIIYLAHKAANPAEYPVREGVIRDGLRQKENAHKFCTPTKVHLQVYDGMCHVLTVFTFTSSADYAYNSIAEFAKHVTQRSAEYLDRNPFPVLQPIPGSDVPSCAMNDRSGDILMIRERVDIHGRVRFMEPKEDITALQLRPSEIGIIKEETLFKWLEGQEEWDRRFKYCATKVMKNRKTIEAKSKSIIKKARQRGLSLVGESDDLVEMPIVGRSNAVYGAIQEDRRWGPLDLVDEEPPPTAIAARRDTREALALLKKSIYHTAPTTHKTIPRVKTVDVVLAAFDPNDAPFRHPRQSVSEQQVRTGMGYIHGMRIWQSIVSRSGRKVAVKAAENTRRVGDALMETGDKAASK